jgi:Flp pilus assembly secretin CpaC
MGRMIAAAVILWAVGSPGFACEGDSSQAKQLCFRCKIVRIDPASGKQIVLAEPTLVTLENRAARFVSGGEIPIPTGETGEDSKPELAQTGIDVRLNARGLRNDRLRVDVTVQVTVQEKTKGDTVRLHTSSLRSVETVRPNQVLHLKLDGGETNPGDQVLEVRVEEYPPRP